LCLRWLQGYLLLSDNSVYLLTIYAKAKKEEISVKEIKNGIE